jgi:hypothetical protein
MHKDHNNVVKRINGLLTNKFNSKPDETDLDDLVAIERKSRRTMLLESDV